MKFSPSQIKSGKVIVVLTWLLVIAAFLLPGEIPFSSIFIGIGAFLIGAHLLEIMFFNKRLKSLNDYIGVFFFGALHLRQLAINHQHSQL